MTIHRRFQVAACGVLVLFCLPLSAHAMPKSEFDKKYEETRQNTRDGKSTWQGEAFDIGLLWLEYGKQRVLEKISSVRVDAPKGGEWFYALYHPDQATDVSLSYAWLTSASLQPTTSPIGSIAGVRYEVNYSPEANFFVFLGESYDALSDFSLNYTIAANSSFEPIFRATPLDAAGVPIELLDSDGSNVAEGYGIALDVPEPASMCLVATGVAALAYRRRLT